jgi:hypothetical protein
MGFSMPPFFLRPDVPPLPAEEQYRLCTTDANKPRTVEMEEHQNGRNPGHNTRGGPEVRV